LVRVNVDVRDDESAAADAEADTVPADEVARVVETEGARGRTAGRPTEIPRRGLRDVFARVRFEAKSDHVTLLSAGIAFYGLLALVPALVAVISIYGLVADPRDVRTQIVDALSASPREVREMVSTQLEAIASSSGASTIIAVILGLLAAVWSASAGVGHLIEALNVAYDEDERRTLVRRKATALAFTFGASVFVAIAFVAIALLPSIVASTGLGAAGRVLVGIVRWVLLLAAMYVGLAVLYRYGPCRGAPQWRWVSPGATVAAVMWILGSLLFSAYTANFAKYNETYGSLGAVVVLMLWLFLTALSVIVGAEVNAEMERQTARDTTAGEPQPMGERGAHAADTLGESADALQHKRRHDGLLAASPPAELAVTAVKVRRTAEFPFEFRGLAGFAARLFGVRADRAHAVVSSGDLEARYGRWVLTTPLTNIRSVHVTGPYRVAKVAGPPHLSLADGGLTFATNSRRGVCITFHEKVPGMLPFGLLPHPGLTMTVAEPELLAHHLRSLCVLEPS
jgi:membrane protein